MSIIRPLLFCAFLLVVAVACLFYPEGIQAYALKVMRETGHKNFSLLPWMESRAYVIALRLIGLFSLCFLALILYALARER